MKAKDLIAKLQEDPEAIVVMMDYNGSTHELRPVQRIESKQALMAGHLSQSLQKRKMKAGEHFIWLQPWK